MCLGLFFFLLPFLLASFHLFLGDLPWIVLVPLIGLWLWAGVRLWRGERLSTDFEVDDDEPFSPPTDAEEEAERLRGKRWND